MNALDRWRRDQDWTYQRLAEALGCNHATASRYCQGRRIPAPVAMTRIFRVTGGAVTANHFYGLPEPGPWIVTLAGWRRRESFEALGWRAWPDDQAPDAPATLMRRKPRPDETWQEIAAELALLSLPDKARGATAPDALIASGVNPD